MGVLRDAALAGAFDLVWASGAAHVMRRLSHAAGLILQFHRVLPDAPADFAPNAGLQVHPEFLDFVVSRLRRLGYETVAMDEALKRLAEPGTARRFVAITFDGGYRDTLRHAAPVLRTLRCPYALYVTTAFADGVGDVWWLALEDIVAAQSAIAVTENDVTDYLPTATLGEKRAAYVALSARLSAMPGPARTRLLHDLATRYDFDREAQCRALMLDWSELRALAADPLCTIGTQGVRHWPLAPLTPAQARGEVELSAQIIAAQLGRRPVHFAHPTGHATRATALLAECGFRSGVTGTPGAVRPGADMLSLPRVPAGALGQRRRHVDVLAAPQTAGLMAGGIPAR